MKVDDLEKPECLEMAAVAMARAFDEAAAAIGLVDALDRDARRALRLKAYDLLAETRKQAAVNYLSSDLDAEINRHQPSDESLAGDPMGFFVKSAPSTSGRNH